MIRMECLVSPHHAQTCPVCCRLAGKRLVALDVAAVVAGSTYRGEFEERLQSLLHDCEAAQGSVVLFIDEIHVLGRFSDESCGRYMMWSVVLRR